MTISDAQKDWKILDHLDFKCRESGIRLISHVPLRGNYAEGLPPVEEIKQGKISRLFSFWQLLSSMIAAFRMLWIANNKTVIIANGSALVGNFICLLNYYLFMRRRTILFWDSHLETKSRLKKYIFKRTFLGCRLATFWSRRQIQNYAQQFDLPEGMLIFIPYKANHSQWQPRKNMALDYVFAGGNGKRDYKTLVEAVRDTDVTVIISTTDPELRKTIEDIPNVIPLAATEPSFAKLMAASRFVVIPMISTGLKGGGEANFCNAMWHGKPIIAVDDISAEDYIVDGENGYIVPPGDVDLLRKRILELWIDNEKCRKMGEYGREIVKKYYTHELCMRRLLRLACVVGEDALVNRQ